MTGRNLAAAAPSPLAIYAADKKLSAQFTARRVNDALKLSVEVEHLMALAKNNATILECTPESIKHTFLQLAAVGLSFNPVRAQCYAVAYFNTNIGAKELTLAVGYRGMEDMVLAAGTIKSIQANVVKQGDAFDVWTDEHGTHLTHVPRKGSDSSRKTTHAYVIAHFMSGGRQVEIMDAIELDNAYKAATKKNAAGGAVWKSVWRSEMEKKTVIRRAWKHWPKDPQGKMEHAMQVMEDTEPMHFADVPPPAAAAQGEAELMVSQDQIMELEAKLHEFEYPVAKHAARMKMITDYFSVDCIQNLPAKHYEEAKTRLVDWLKRWKEQPRK